MGWGTLVKGVVTSVIERPRTAVMLGKLGAATGLSCYAGWKFFVKDEGMDEIAVGFLGDQAKENYKQKGILGLVKGKAAGNNAVEQSVGEIAVDGVLGDGTFSKSADTVGKVVDGTGNVLNAVGDGAQDIYHGATDTLSNLMNNRGGQQQLTPEQFNQLLQAYQQQTGQQLPLGSEQLYQLYQQQALAQSPQGNSLFSMLNPFSSVGSLVDNGINNFNKGGLGLSLASLIPALFLMFGNFGWMGKIGSLFLGTLAYRNMRQHQMLSPSLPYTQSQQIQQRPIYGQQPSFQNVLDNQYQEDNVINRSRGI